MFTIYLNGEFFNRIVASAEFAAQLCESMSKEGETYTFEEYFYPDPPEEPEEEAFDDTEVLNTLLGVSE